MAAELIPNTSGAYCLVQSNEKAEIAFEANKLIPEGWKPEGGLTAVATGGYFLYIQVFVRLE